ncbi:hypothetical protein [Chryseobacterium sp. LAM-KRS1]|uniref:hypothetical protein n=1 Tax=Chryseobacterium sp. LAM-KRS1 TaxID=2715754 RepID=UPI0015580937|nr:hypothetical protein [Chryseobacterium sp. LAM-KRS1]
MKQKFENLCLKINIWLFIVPMGILFGIMSFFLIPGLQAHLGTTQLLDTMFSGYSTEYAEYLMQKLGHEGRHSYLSLELYADVPFIFFYVTVFTLLTVRLLIKNRLWNSWFRFIAFLPLLAGIFDWLENSMIISVLIQYPDINGKLISISSFATYMKGCFLILMFLSLLLNLMMILYRFIVSKSNHDF